MPSKPKPKPATLNDAKYFAGLVENAAYNKGHISGAKNPYNKRNDGQLSLAELLVAKDILRYDNQTDRSVKAKIGYAIENFNRFDKPKNYTLSHQELINVLNAYPKKNP